MTAIDDFLELFQGLSNYHVQYTPKEKSEAGEKQEVDYQALYEPVTSALVEKHLGTNTHLAITPILDNGYTSLFGVIDIDNYTALSHQQLAASIHKNKLPLIVCGSKSGGAHLYCFSDKPVPCMLMKQVLESFVVTLGLSAFKFEIFPKQNSLLRERGDVGSTINLPYGVMESVAYDIKGNKLLFEDFVAAAKANVVDLRKISTTNKLLDFKDGPPCLEHLVKNSHELGKGVRNNFLYAVRTYCEAAKLNLTKYVMQINLDILDDPLEEHEVKSICGRRNQNIDNDNRKPREYKCNEAPINAHCNKEVCKLRKYGISATSGNMPTLGDLTKLNGDEPTWFLEIEDAKEQMVRVEFNSEELLQPAKFKKRCMTRVNFVPTLPPPFIWNDMLNQKMATCNHIEPPYETSIEGQVMMQLTRFCRQSGKGLNQSELAAGRPWVDGTKIYFRSVDFYNFIVKNRSINITMDKLSAVFYKLTEKSKVKKDTLKDKNDKAIDVYYIENLEAPVELAIPQELSDESLI